MAERKRSSHLSGDVTYEVAITTDTLITVKAASVPDVLKAVKFLRKEGCSWAVTRIIKKDITGDIDSLMEVDKS